MTVSPSQPVPSRVQSDAPFQVLALVVRLLGLGERDRDLGQSSLKLDSSGTTVRPSASSRRGACGFHAYAGGAFGNGPGRLLVAARAVVRIVMPSSQTSPLRTWDTLHSSSLCDHAAT